MTPGEGRRETALKGRSVARGRPAGYGQEILARRRRLTASLIPFEGRTVLDFGCGNGAQTVELAGAQRRLIAVDIDLADLLILRAASDPAGVIFPVLYGGSDLPLPDGSVDAAVCFEVLEHVPDEAAALAEIRRVLKPGGDFVLTVPNKWWIFETHGAALPLLPWNRVPFFSWLPGPLHRRFAHARIYRRKDIVRLVTRHGFSVHAFLYVTAPMDALGKSWLRDVLRAGPFSRDSTTCPLMATAILLHCRKEGNHER
jgi:SAM-dependent methyltransferase